jgi:hypothetical protein
VETIQLVGAIVATLVAFLFVGLNVSRLKLSRDLLDTYLLKAQKKNRLLQQGNIITTTLILVEPSNAFVQRFI